MPPGPDDAAAHDEVAPVEDDRLARRRSPLRRVESHFDSLPAWPDGRWSGRVAVTNLSRYFERALELLARLPGSGYLSINVSPTAAISR